MRRKITVFLIAAILCFTGVAAAADPCWESCGTKVNEGDIDAVYALLTAATDLTINPQFAFFDYNIAGGTVGAFDDYDSGYIDMDGDGLIDPNIDVRITPWHNVPADDPQFKYPANTKVANDLDQGLPLVIPANQQVLCFIDLEQDGFDIADPIYVDTNNDNVVTVHDIRLTSNGWGYSAYTTVGTYDADKGETLILMPLIPALPGPQGSFQNLLGYIDDDCSTTWTCPDKLYLQQSKTAPTVVDPDPNGDNFVTIGDLRIYIPPEAIENEFWPSCGTKVEEGDIDAVYTLNVPFVNGLGARIMYYDFNGNGVFDGIDSAYVDMVDIAGVNNRVDNGDVRITAHHNVAEGDDDYKYPPNTKVINDLDQGLPLVNPGQAGLIKYFETNDVVANANYDAADYLYVDMDQNSIISIYDIRLTPREDYGYDAYTTVAAGDLDLYDPWPFLPVGGGLTPAQLIAYIDDDCSGTWTCSDKLYLEQPINIAPLVWVSERIVTIGDFRLYIPPEAIENEDWPSCGTKVEQCDIDAVYLLKNSGVAAAGLSFYDYDGDGVFDDRDTLYIDVNGGLPFVEAGDIRLTPWHNVDLDDPDCKYPANTKVGNDLDLNKPLIPLVVSNPAAGLGYEVAYFDINGNALYDVEDPLYIDISSTAGLGQVSLFDVRLTPTAGYDAYTSVRAGDLDLIENRVLTPIIAPGIPISAYIGYIDSDCSDDWTCVDKLYLKQAFQNIFDDTNTAVPGLVGAVTIGDFRLYIPPEEIGEGSGYPYDENGNSVIDMPELMEAIGDWKIDSLSMGELMEIIGYWKAGAI